MGCSIGPSGVEATTALQIQVSHAGGQVVENLTNIIDPSMYPYTAAPAPQAANGNGNRNGNGGALSRMMTLAERQTTGVDQFSQTEQSGLATWLSTGGEGSGTNGIERLRAQERAMMVAWLNAKREGVAPGTTNLNQAGGGPPPILGRLPIHSTLAGEFTDFSQGRLFQLQDGSKWQQVSNVTLNYYPQRGPSAINATVRASGSTYLLDVKGAQTVIVKPVR